MAMGPIQQRNTVVRTIKTRCPVCFGKGKVPNGFYWAVGTEIVPGTDASPETCKACGGAGTVSGTETLHQGTN